MDGKTPWDKLSSEIYPYSSLIFIVSSKKVFHILSTTFTECFCFCFSMSVIFIFFLRVQIMIMKFVVGLLLIIYLFIHNNPVLLFD